jgi:hypothetical protein
MQITIHKIVRPLALREFAPEYGDQTVSVWVNPPRQLLEAYAPVQAESRAIGRHIQELAKKGGEITEADRQAVASMLSAVNQRFSAWFAEVWSQDEDPSTHATAEEVQSLSVYCESEDPALWKFLIQGTWQLIDEHRLHAKKG